MPAPTDVPLVCGLVTRQCAGRSGMGLRRCLTIGGTPRVTSTRIRSESAASCGALVGRVLKRPAVTVVLEALGHCSEGTSVTASAMTSKPLAQGWRASLKPRTSARSLSLTSRSMTRPRSLTTYELAPCTEARHLSCSTLPRNTTAEHCTLECIGSHIVAVSSTTAQPGTCRNHRRRRSQITLNR